MGFCGNGWLPIVLRAAAAEKMNGTNQLLNLTISIAVLSVS